MAVFTVKLIIGDKLHISHVHMIDKLCKWTILPPCKLLTGWWVKNDPDYQYSTLPDNVIDAFNIHLPNVNVA